MATWIPLLDVCALEGISEAGWWLGERLRSLPSPSPAVPLLHHLLTFLTAAAPGVHAPPCVTASEKESKIHLLPSHSQMCLGLTPSPCLSGSPGASWLLCRTTSVSL